MAVVVAAGAATTGDGVRPLQRTTNRKLHGDKATMTITLRGNRKNEARNIIIRAQNTMKARNTMKDRGKTTHGVVRGWKKCPKRRRITVTMIMMRRTRRMRTISTACTPSLSQLQATGQVSHRADGTLTYHHASRMHYLQRDTQIHLQSAPLTC